jgi:thioredoxin 1
MLQIFYFTSKTCSPCKSFGPIVEQARTEFHDVFIQKVDVDVQKELALKYEVRSVPKLVFEKNGQVVDSSTGVISRAALNQLIIKHR